MKSQFKLALAASALASVLLVGCGDDGGSSSAPSNADQIVATYEDLTLCTANREGASAYVKDEKTEYVCTGGDWIPASDAPSSQGGSSAASSGAPDASSAADSSMNGSSAMDQSSVSSGEKTDFFDLGVCSAANNGEIRQDTNSLSSSLDVYFICDTAIANWRRATAMEYDTYRWTAGNDGAIRKGTVTDAKYKYDELQGRWTNANRLDTTLGLNGCTQKREAEVSRGNNGVYYICKGVEWQVVTGPEYDTYGWVAGNDGAIEDGNITNLKYKYDSLQGRWLSANDPDIALGLNGCTQKREAEVGKGSDDVYYICNGGIWRSATTLEYDTYPNLCANVGVTLTGTVTATPYYCTDNGWLSMADWSWDVPKEAWLNPNIPYGTMTDNRDNQTYKTVVIGSQTWMAENLNYEYKVNGASYGNWCYNDSARYCSVTGHLYTWGAAMDSVSTGCGLGKECTADTGRVQGICPNGWHLPCLAEWDTLFAATAVGGQSVAGTALKTTLGWHDYGNGTNGTDVVGFSALPFGYRYINGNFEGVGYYAQFWSSSELDTRDAYLMDLRFGLAKAIRADYNKYLGIAVRCVKD